jgi:hypothetical protein
MVLDLAIGGIHMCSIGLATCGIHVNVVGLATGVTSVSLWPLVKVG